MKICVIGGSGVIGSKFVEGFSNDNDVYYTYFQNIIENCDNHKRLDITDKESTINYIKNLKPDIVIQSAALANVDLCETNKKLADMINIDGCKNIIEGCKITNSKIVFISTSFVFDGKKNEYFENDKTSPSTHYGVTKLRGEEIVKDSGLPYLILRTDQPYCWIKKGQRINSVLRVLSTLQEGKILYEVEDWFNTPTYVPELVSITVKLIKNNLNGIFHVVSSDFISRYEWSIRTSRIFGLDETKIKPINSEKLNLPVKRPNVNLKNWKISEKLNIKMKGIDEGIGEMKKQKLFY